MYPLKQHKNLSVEKWYGYSRAEQVLMIANELNRAKNCITGQDTGGVDSCYERALELTDLTGENDKWRGSALRELRRFREVLAAQWISREKDPVMNTHLYRLLLQLSPAAWNMLSAGQRPKAKG